MFGFESEGSTTFFTGSYLMVVTECYKLHGKRCDLLTTKHSTFTIASTNEL